MARLEGLAATDFSAGHSYFRMGREPVAVDILSEIPGVGFDTAWANRVEEVIDAATGLKALFISSADLVTAKLASGRLQDIADVDAIRRATKLQTTADGSDT